MNLTCTPTVAAVEPLKTRLDEPAEALERKLATLRREKAAQQSRIQHQKNMVALDRDAFRGDLR